ncbi:hypothetical protein ACHAPA_006648 [Fusarium lateritium]
MDGRKMATGLEEVHVHKILDHTETHAGVGVKLRVQHQGYPQKDASWEPFEKTWHQRNAVVDQYVIEHEGLLLPSGLESEDETTSDEEWFDSEKEVAVWNDKEDDTKDTNSQGDEQDDATLVRAQITSEASQSSSK